MLNRRHALALPALLPALLAGTARAQAWTPSRPLRVIVPFSAGGAADSSTRVLGPRMGERLGQPIAVENRTGAGGSLGAGEVARAAPDGQTLLMDASSHIVNPSLLRGLPFDYSAAFTPISQVVTFPQVLAVKADLPARNLEEFLALARRQPLNIGTQGNATAGHLGLAMLSRAGGVELTHVAYRGGAAAARDLAGGTLDGVFITLLSAKPIVESGRARFIALSAPQRVALAPELATFAELGIRGVELSEWTGLFAPSGTPPAAIAAIHAALRAALDDAEVAQRLAQIGAVPLGSTPEVFARFVTEGRAEMARLVQAANIRIE
jgi:tripartite-type tricarboxylate transporter receptor subunit TctC